MLKPLLVAGVRPDRDGVVEGPRADFGGRRSIKNNTPLTAATGVVPLRIAPPAFVPSATVTLPVKPGTRFPSTSSARTFTAGVIRRFATVVPGSVPNTSWVAAPGVILKPLLVAGVRPIAVAVSA